MIPERVDVLIIGGGPAGLYAASRIAREGHQVLVCEEHPGIGEPVHCTGVLAADTFDEFGVPTDSILNPLATVRFFSPGGRCFAYTTPRPEAVVIDRATFDLSLATAAIRDGAQLATSARVTALEIGRSAAIARVAGTSVTARLVVLACGAKYFFHRPLGIGLPSAYLHTAQRELPATEAGDVELHFGGEVAPGGFAWAVPVVRDGRARVRIGVMASQWAPRWYDAMVRRVSDRWGVTAVPAPPRLKILPLGPIQRTVADRVLVVGDAAGIVKPTTGGGIYYSLMTAAFAAETANRALERDRLGESDLAEYEGRWRDRLDDEIASQMALRRVAERMTDTEIDSLFELAQTDGIIPIVRRTARFNEHRHLIRALFRHPPARRILFQSLASAIGATAP